ncbi:hypothetical protein ILYODFUR_032665 [Ilyodon furcidens]|uniref:Uncharacterized protein n=1 Tax=Ilyodon furcidens TaxID=33524 RepID=A0ABV0UY96_9TELE
MQVMENIEGSSSRVKQQHLRWSVVILLVGKTEVYVCVFRASSRAKGHILFTPAPPVQPVTSLYWSLAGPSASEPDLCRIYSHVNFLFVFGIKIKLRERKEHEISDFY